MNIILSCSDYCVLAAHVATFRGNSKNTCIFIVCWDQSTVKKQTLFIKTRVKWLNSDEHKILEVKNCCLWSDVHRRYEACPEILDTKVLKK
jgi:hypothetical protein